MVELLKSIKLLIVNFRFRIRNRHNRVYAVSNFPIDNVSVGRESYGPLHIIWMAPLSAHLSIGNYCSIGPEVVFLMGGGTLL